jgi:hypothetical protein
MHRQLLAQFDGRGLVADAGDKELHEQAAREKGAAGPPPG